MLSDERIKKFQMLYLKRFGKTISREEAYEKGVKLMRLVEITYQPMTEAEYKQLQERRKQTGDL
jgi:two-component SAPR family response regulator